MANFITYDASGTIICYGTCRDGDVALQAIEPGHSVIQAAYQPGSVVNGALVPLSPTDLAVKQKADFKAHIAEQIAARKGASKQ